MKNNYLRCMVVAMAAAALFSGSAVYATDTTETAAVGTTAETEAPTADTAETQAETDTVSTKEYILLLPVKDGVTYGLDESHVSDQYSSANYTVMLYKEGEQVDITVSGASEFYVADALDADGENIADGADGKLSFVMPAQDLTVTVPSWAIETEAETDADGAQDTADATAATATAEAGSDIRISITRLNVRAGASSSTSLLGLLHPGDRVKVTGTEGDWLAVKFVKDGAAVDGYVYSKYVTETTSLYTVSADTTIYSSASETASQMGQLTAGTEIVVKEVGTDGWSKVAYESDNQVNDGYVKTEALAAVTNPTVDALLS